MFIYQLIHVCFKEPAKAIYTFKSCQEHIMIEFTTANTRLLNRVIILFSRHQ